MGARWSWPSALTGAATATAVAVLILGRPKDPSFEIASISLSSFKFNIPLLDIEVTLTVHITNPNLVPVLYDPATVSIYYAGTHLGSAQVEAGTQPAKSCRILHLPARLNSLKMAHHARSLLADIARREMELYATVDIPGVACLFRWRHSFIIHVESRVFVDPVLLQVIEQENHSQAQLTRPNLTVCSRLDGPGRAESADEQLQHSEAPPQSRLLALEWHGGVRLYGSVADELGRCRGQQVIGALCHGPTIPRWVDAGLNR